MEGRREGVVANLERTGGGGAGVGGRGVVVNPMYLISFAVSESSRG